MIQKEHIMDYNNKSYKLAKAYRENPKKKSFNNQIIKAFYFANDYQRGKLSVVFPLHEEAYTIHFHELDLNIKDLKERRKAKNS